ncbi:hypothetical protein ACHQM5_021890 [Ranunculus cassubicifolius]
MIQARWVAKKLEDEVRCHYLSYKPKDLIDAIWEKHQTHISYGTAWRARIKIMEMIYGNYEESYKLGPALCYQMIKRNPGGVASCSRDHNTEQFTSLCIAFRATLDGWKAGCRPVLGLDGCHLKGKYGGVLLSITGLDGNNGLYPIAIYICRSEGYHTWKDFLQQLEYEIKDHPQAVTFISDQQKGLNSVIHEIFPGSEQRFCFRLVFIYPPLL